MSKKMMLVAERDIRCKSGRGLGVDACRLQISARKTRNEAGKTVW